jgi:SAM-dependent methyltransferase
MKEYLINSLRFKGKLPYTNHLIKQYPRINHNIFNFFNTIAKNKYKLKKTICLCEGKNYKILSKIDRNFIKFTTIVCTECGLIRAKRYYRKKDVIDFYKNYYRKIYTPNTKNSKLFYLNQYKLTYHKYNLIKKFSKNILNKKIVDVGGGAGGVLNHFKGNNNKLYLIDYYRPHLIYAKSQGINTIIGDLDKIKFKPDIIILSHVIEHWNDFKSNIKKLIQIQKKGVTLNYIEFPGIDSLKLGRRFGDILGDIHVPHVYYFSSYVFENLMNRYGFKKIYIDSEIKSIFIYNGVIKDKKNYYQKVNMDLKIAENIRVKYIVKNFIKLFIPNIILDLVRKLVDRIIRY